VNAVNKLDGISVNKFLTSNQSPDFFVNSDKLIDESFSYRIIMNISNGMYQCVFFNDAPVVNTKKRSKSRNTLCEQKKLSFKPREYILRDI